MIDGTSHASPRTLAGAVEPRPAAAPRPDDRYAALRAELERAVGRVCPRWLADRREDLVQGALLRVMEAERRGGARDLAPAYLARAAYSALVDEIRRLRRRREVPIDGGEAPAEPAAPEPGPQRDAQAGEIGRGIRDCLGRMAAPRRTAVTLHLLGHGVPDVARLARWPVKRAENLVYRGLDDLRRCLRQKGLEP